MTEQSNEKELCIHRYEGENKWSIEIYNDDAANNLARRCKMVSKPTVYDGMFWEATTEQMIYFLRLLNGESIRVPKKLAQVPAERTPSNSVLDPSLKKKRQRRGQK